MPTIASYGLAVLIYQDGLLDFLHVPSLSKTNGLFWSVPVMTFTFLFGLGLDYDLMIFSRIWEFRSEGYSDRDAICLGIASMGPTIFTAGIIFTLEMAGALLSSVPIVNQLGAVIVISVLFDITIVETCFVPALLSLAPQLNWWPKEMPAAHRTLDRAARHE